LLGYLAYLQGQKRKRTILHYALKRYIFSHMCPHCELYILCSG
jgi:hypothetical protein